MNQERVFKVLLGPHVTEKAAMAAERNQYVFKVASDATKPEIKKAVEALFGKKVGIPMMPVSARDAIGEHTGGREMETTLWLRGWNPRERRMTKP